MTELEGQRHLKDSKARIEEDSAFLSRMAVRRATIPTRGEKRSSIAMI